MRAIFCTIVLAASMVLGRQLLLRPCNLRDYGCVRKYLGANSRCNGNVRGTVSSNYVVEEFTYETPATKSTNVERNLIVRNEDKCYVSEFFIDSGKNITVLGIDCPELSLEADRTVLQHYPLREDNCYKYHFKTVYPLLRLTLNIRNLDVCNAYVFPDIPSLPTTYVNSKALLPPGSARDLRSQYIQELESLSARAGPIARIFVNYVLCDFGCKPVENVTGLGN